jgi:chorismate mutase
MIKENIMKLNTLRSEIDKIDVSLLVLLHNRLVIVKKIGKIKKKNGVKIVDKDREKEIINQLIQKGVVLSIEKGFIKKIFKIIIKESKMVQKNEK